MQNSHNRKPRIFLGSSGAQSDFVQALTRGLQDIAHVEPWTTSFNPGTTTIERLLELTHEVDFAAFIFARDDWTVSGSESLDESGQSSPRDNVVFEAGLFGGVLGMRRTFILHAKGTKLPTDLLGLTNIRYGDALETAEMQLVIEKLRHAIENQGFISSIEGFWWQFSLTARSVDEPSAISLLRISRDKTRALEISGRSWREDGILSARYWSEASKERTSPPGIFYYFNGERPKDPNAPAIEGVGEITIESADRAVGYFTTCSRNNPNLNTRTSGVYLRADPRDVMMLDGNDNEARVKLIAEQLANWKVISNS